MRRERIKRYWQNRAGAHGERKMDDGGQNGKSETKMDRLGLVHTHTHTHAHTHTRTHTHTHTHTHMHTLTEWMSDQKEGTSQMDSIRLLEPWKIKWKSKKSLEDKNERTYITRNQILHDIPHTNIRWKQRQNFLPIYLFWNSLWNV